MTGEQLLCEMLDRLELYCYPRFGPGGVQEALTNEQLDNFSDAMLLLIARNKVRESKDGN
jgi:hypothetical protein